MVRERERGGRLGVGIGANKRLNIDPPINHSAVYGAGARAVKGSDRALSLARVQVNLDEKKVGRSEARV